ncbi:GNAT family N-acetyltransferase [Acidaminobacter sp. JC074]|uniref:GNAT family N-acetyltransferase n=1 Tax=Acidaminobacter sp. JC074 TaxID=2530199 RepID=UPI001F114E5F|nr:GNAT family N-acetyltransferase [Acidaminobacter sp. JC074]MCH4886851.1 GNAT family N-acetyltransferase [Acidaminobacter sp. JC074]
MDWRTLRSKRLIFEPLSEDILNDMHTYVSDEDVSRFIGWPLTKELEETKDYLNKLFENEKNKTHEYASMVFDGRHIGTVMLFNFSYEAKNLEIGYVMHRDFWHKGLMTEAVSLMMDYIEKETDFHKVCARVVSGNMASGKVLEKNGFDREGLLKDQYYIDNKYYDALYYGKIINR